MLVFPVLELFSLCLSIVRVCFFICEPLFNPMYLCQYTVYHEMVNDVGELFHM